MIEFKITIEENLESAQIEFTAETKDAPDATAGEIETAKALNIMLAAFKEQSALNAKKPALELPKNRIIHN